MFFLDVELISESFSTTLYDSDVQYAVIIEETDKGGDSVVSKDAELHAAIG